MKGPGWLVHRLRVFVHFGVQLMRLQTAVFDISDCMKLLDDSFIPRVRSWLPEALGFCPAMPRMFFRVAALNILQRFNFRCLATVIDKSLLKSKIDRLLFAGMVE